jgi:hypothetical protein
MFTNVRDAAKGVSVETIVSAIVERIGRVAGIAPATLRKPWAMMLVVVCLAAIAGAMFQSAVDVRKYPGTDQRARVVGARMMLAGQNPYATPQDAQTPEKLLDPDRLFSHITRCTYPPTMLYLYVPVAELGWNLQRPLLAAAEWGAMLASIVLLAWTVKGQRRRLWFIAAGVLLIACSPSFRMHVERGQFYVFILLLISVAGFLLARRLAATRGERGGWQPITAGIALGLAAAFRPNLAVLLVPLWFVGLRTPAIAMGVTGAVVGLSTLAIPAIGVQGWRDYFTLVRELDMESMMGRARYVAQLVAPAGFQTAPETKVVEGVDFSGYLRGPVVNISANTVVSMFANDATPFAVLAKAIKAGALLVFAVGCVPLAMLVRRRGLPAGMAMGCALVPCIAMEYFLPVRYNYADVILLAPLALLAGVLFSRRCAVLTGIMLGGLAMFSLSQHASLAWVANGLFAAGSMIVVFAIARARRASVPAA